MEEDLQFSSEEEPEEGLGLEGGGDEWGAEGMEQIPQDESQQAAMAMVQLGNLGFYAEQGELAEVKGMVWKVKSFDILF